MQGYRPPATAGVGDKSRPFGWGLDLAASILYNQGCKSIKWSARDCRGLISVRARGATRALLYYVFSVSHLFCSSAVVEFVTGCASAAHSSRNLLMASSLVAHSPPGSRRASSLMPRVPRLIQRLIADRLGFRGSRAAKTSAAWLVLIGLPIVVCLLVV